MRVTEQFVPGEADMTEEQRLAALDEMTLPCVASCPECGIWFDAHYAHEPEPEDEPNGRQTETEAVRRVGAAIKAVA